MTYTKPTVTSLGDAETVIQGNPKTGSPSDGSGHIVPAYDLDE